MTDLVFLPGWSYRASVFEIMKPHLANHRLHFIDLPKLHDADWLPEFAESLPQHATLIGWSLGGLISMMLCARFPERFQRLILLASSPKFTAEYGDEFLHQAQQDMQQTLTQFHTLTSFPSRAARQYFAAHTYDVGNTPTLLKQLHFLFETDLRASFHARTLSHLAIHGARDAVLKTPVADAHVIANAGHGFIYTHTAEACQHIQSYLAQTR